MKRSHFALSTLLFLAIGHLTEAATTCSGVELYSKAAVRYGRWEIRMKAAATPGSVSSFFTYNNNSYLGAPHPWREIDIEVLGNKPSSFQSNLITGDASAKTTSETIHGVSGLADGFHTYVLDWTPDSVVWRVDGSLRRKVDATDPQVRDLRDSTQTWRMNLWASSSTAWVGALDLSKLPVAQVVNWMRFSSYTPGKGPGGSDFTFSWLDDFDRLQSSRWALGDWTFDGNLAQFSTSNAVFKDGYLALLLTRPGEEGVIGATLPKDPSGNSYSDPASVRANSTDAPFRAISTGEGFRIEGLEGRVEVRDSAGKILWSGHADSQGRIEFRTSAKGLALVRTGDRVGSVILR